MTKHIKNDDERQQGTANHIGNPGDRVVDKTTLIFTIAWLLLAIGSFFVRELYKGNKIIDTMLGGINVWYFCFVEITILMMICNYIVNKKSNSFNYMISNLLLYPFLLILGYVMTIIFIESYWPMVVWLPVMSLIFANAMGQDSGSVNK